MDELDKDRSTAQVIVAAGAAAAVLAGVALALTRKKERDEPAEAGEEAVAAASDRAGEALSSLEEHAPEAARRLRERLAGLKKFDKSAIERVVSESRHEGRKSAREAGGDIRQRAEAALRELRQEAEEVDLSKLTPNQAAAAQAAAAAVARAERALGAGANLADSARDGAHALTDEFGPALRDAVLHAAELIGEQVRGARSKAEAVAPEDAGSAATHLAAAAGERAHDVTEAVKGRASELGERAEHLGERAKDTSRKAAEATVETGKESGAMFAWLAAALGAIFYLLLDEERRRQVTEAAGEASVQFRELMRDFRGYDDEF